MLASLRPRPVTAEPSARYWLDTEFIDSGFDLLHLISIGLVAEDGREYYAINADCPLERAGEWVREHVLPRLEPGLAIPRARIREEVRAFIEAGAGEPEVWAYMPAYDWVIFCQLFGPMSELPDGWPKFCRDIKQWAELLGSPELPGHNDHHHHALWDARWAKQAWEALELLSDST